MENESRIYLSYTYTWEHLFYFGTIISGQYGLHNSPIDFHQTLQRESDDAQDEPRKQYKDKKYTH